MPDNSDTSLERGRRLSEQVMPGLEAALAERYDTILPGFSEMLVATTWGEFYDRDGLDMKSRQLCTIAALAAMGGQTRPQLKVHVAGALRGGATEREIAEAIMQMALYGGFPSMINALNAAMEVFDEQEAA